MTALTYVTAKEMKKRTGLSTALGYAFPEEDEILVRKGLDPELKKEVLAHEEEHILKGEEGPGFFKKLLGIAAPIVGNLIAPGIGGVIGGAVGSVIGGEEGASDAQRSAGSQVAGLDQDIAYQRESRDLARADQAPYREAGNTALQALMSLTGLGGPQGGVAQPAPVAPQSSPANQSPNWRYGDDIHNPFSRFGSSYGRALGGPTAQGQMYNINEMGPENVYSGGTVTRNPNPMTIDGQTGYVQPNIQGRVAGGYTSAAHRNTVYSGRQPVPYELPPQQVLPGPQVGGQPSGNANTTAINPQTGYPNENPGGVEGGYQFQTDPGYQFRFEEGQRALDRGAAARGGLLSGGYGRKAIRYGQGFASNEFSNVYNRISNIAGLGQVSAGQSGQYAMMAGQGMGQSAAQSGYALAAGQQAGSNARSNAWNQVAQLPWGDWFGGSNNTRLGSSPGTGRTM